MFLLGELCESVKTFVTVRSKEEVKSCCLFHRPGRPVEVKGGGKISMVIRLLINVSFRSCSL